MIVKKKSVLILPKNSSSSAFTIVELLIVIVIIGILAAITIVSYTGITARANTATVQADLANNAKKLSMYYAQYGEYPKIDPGSGCPTTPTADTNYCLKVSSGNSFKYSYKTASTYELTEKRGTVMYGVTESSAPVAIVLDDANWLTIGSQRWAKANLNVGTMVTGVTAQTNNSSIEKYCYSSSESNCTTYGALYQWDEAMGYTNTEGAQGICPAGSHIPSDNDWKIMEVALGMTQAAADMTGGRGTDQGTQLKSGGSSGLNLPFAGYRNTDGSFGNLSSSAYLWSSSESGSNAWNRGLDASSSVGRGATNLKTFGFSVRCLGN